jgi:hypothetical protein
MSGVTGIELGPSACVLVRTGRDGSASATKGRSVTAARTFDSRDRDALGGALRAARREYGFSSRARVVAWSAPGSQVALDLDHLPDISPIVAAGFDVESIVSPPQALALMLEAQHIDTRRGAVAAVSLNVHGAAIAIVHHGQVVSARTIHWTLGEPFNGERPELLDRYLVISQLAPHLQHLIELAGPVYNATVTSVVMCGSLPDLRSLSMLLIEEMDIEVETLDSSELLSPAVVLTSESPASLQLAAAVSTSAEPPPPAPAPPAGPAKPAAEEHREAASLSSRRHVVGSIAFVLCAAWASMQVVGSAPAASAFPDGFAAASPATAPLSMPRPEATMGRLDPIPPPAAPAAAEPLPPEPPVRLPAPVARPAAPPTAEIEPLPRVEGIAISGDRRLAILDGAIVGLGDRVGTRTVRRIERDGVVLADRRGREVFVAIRTRKSPPGGS